MILEKIEQSINIEPDIAEIINDNSDDDYDTEGMILNKVDNIYKIVTHNLKLNVYTKGNFYDIFNDLITDINKKTLLSKTFIKRRYYEIILDSVKDFIEENNPDNEEIRFRYPELADKDFNKKIFLKKEFNKLRYGSSLLKQQAIQQNFRPTSTQTFVQQYLSPNTPYNGLLVWHGVGLGKTCSAILAAEEYKEYLNKFGKKINILLPSTQTLEKTWKEEIFNIDKEKIKRGDVDNLQCTGSIYTNLYNKYKNNGNLNDDQIKRKINKHINKYYDFYGYQKFANDVINHINQFYSKGNKTKQQLIIEYIKETFSKCFFIIDEAHGIRPKESNDTNGKDITFVLNLISRYADDCKIMLLSATPMFDKSEEIIDLVNILLQNDKRSPIFHKKIFDSNTNFIDGGENSFINKTRGYVSYARGENIYTFPLRLYPSENFIPNPKIDFKRKPLSENILNNTVKFYKSQFTKDHLKYYNTIPTDKTLSSFGYQAHLETSTIVFPNSSNDGYKYGEEGFKDCITDSGNLKYQFKQNALIDGKPFLDIDHIQNFSPKIFSILDAIEKCKTGIIFIYSNRVNAGIIPIAIALELLGYTNYIGDGKVQPLVDLKKSKKSKGNFVILYGKTKNTDSLRQEINGLTGYGKNTNGEHIKIILGTDTVQQGISFLGVREIHILEPWHNISKLDQAVGRGFRNKSHIKLDENKRNLTVYYHINTTSDGSHETIDEYMYRIAFEKDKKIARIARLLKENAVDCFLNKEGNTSMDKLKGLQINSRGEEINVSTISIYNDGSRNCDYENCDFICKSNTELSSTDKIDNITFNIEVLNHRNIDVCIDLIKYLFYKNTFLYNLVTLKSHINELDNTVTDEEIYLSIDKMLREKTQLFIKQQDKKYEGYLTYLDGHYIFNAIDIKENASLSQKVILPEPKKKKFILNIISKSVKGFNIVKKEKDDINSNVKIQGNFGENDFDRIVKGIIYRSLNKPDKSKDFLINCIPLLLISEIDNKKYNGLGLNLLKLGEILYNLDICDFKTKKDIISHGLMNISEHGNIRIFSHNFTKNLNERNWVKINTACREIFNMSDAKLRNVYLVLLLYGRKSPNDKSHIIFWKDIDYNKVINVNENYECIFKLYDETNRQYFGINSDGELTNVTKISEFDQYGINKHYGEDEIIRMLYLFFYKKSPKTTEYAPYYNYNENYKGTSSDARKNSRGAKFDNIILKKLNEIIKHILPIIFNKEGHNTTKIVETFDNPLEKKFTIECKQGLLKIITYLIRLLNDTENDTENDILLLTKEESDLFKFTK